MSTKHSPLSVLTMQADNIAHILKLAEAGRWVAPQFQAAITRARANETFKVGIAMDDKVISLDIPWTVIKKTSEPALAAWIVRHMQEKRADEA